MKPLRDLSLLEPWKPPARLHHAREDVNAENADAVAIDNARRRLAKVGVEVASLSPDEIVALDAQKQAEWEALRPARERKRLAAAILAGIPLAPPMLAALLDNTATGPAIDAARAWLASDRAVVVLAGPVGVGKTVAAAWAMVEWASAHIDGRAEFLPSRDMARRAFAFTSEREDVPELPSRGFVLLDDLGAQVDNRERFNAALCMLLDSATSGCLRIAATTNLSVDLLRALLDDRTRDRLNDVGKLAVVKGQSMRRGDGGV